VPAYSENIPMGKLLKFFILRFSYSAACKPARARSSQLITPIVKIGLSCRPRGYEWMMRPELLRSIRGS
ncbi:hypothetical protein, partial [Pseudomonas viridiflava]|uniref:hypothetical protein n=1 Tax=Pseudomonas viridiflava TaxID=33069 RepID=UPI001981E663